MDRADLIWLMTFIIAIVGFSFVIIFGYKRDVEKEKIKINLCESICKEIRKNKGMVVRDVNFDRVCVCVNKEDIKIFKMP